MPFTDLELAYLREAPLGRLATVSPKGQPQARPVAFSVNTGTGTIDIGGHSMGQTQKFRNVAANPLVSLVVDDIPSTDPWQVRCVEIRGWAEAITGAPTTGYSNDIIRIHPTRILTLGLDPEHRTTQARDVAGAAPYRAPSPGPRARS
ncbi:PPOX class F420-dependent oxidoreductase [Streptomyces mutabilis]|uniref:PPOX class F420-dependent oxidoreductase n=1 Tax=Streptomyces mutabilis TaxID=67332 RepID=UPI0006934B77|nr:PPOX class F420-dependent oxidoreductase [Streptomyces mutabilis]GGQ46677.1 PPOX class F420-dependent oxidoreductase [Streptomyces mutabilis]